MYGKLVDDMRQKQMTMVTRCRVNAILYEQTGPREGHESAQLKTLSFVAGIVVVNVRTGLLHQKAGELK